MEQNDISNKKKEISDEISRVVYVGGVIESKGCIEIIKVAENFPNIEFRLVGKPEKKIMEIDKTPNVVLCGEKSKENVTKELEEADIFIFVSYFVGEGFSNALAEAMAKGLPCIVSDWAANRDMIEDSGGSVVNIQDVNAIAEAITDLYDDKAKRQDQSEWNIKKVKENYIDNIVTDMYVDAYESLLTK